MKKLSSLTDWWRLAKSWPVVRRAIFYAVIVGPILIAINHGDTIACGQLSAACVFKMLLTLSVPYMVSTLSSVHAMAECTKT